MEGVTLVVMAAGIGSRFGGGIKQLEPVGPNGEIIMDYSIFDAIEAGFKKVVFIIRKDLEEDFRRVIGERIEKAAEVAYVFQELDDIPVSFRDKFADRKKPWGTGQAVLCCKDVVKTPFVVINADDYYGKEAFVEAYDYLSKGMEHVGKSDMCMIGFLLKNTLSDNGSVTRGLCSVGQDGKLEKIRETYNIEKEDGKIVASNGNQNEKRELDGESIVSMNMWGFFPHFFDVLESGFVEFLESLGENELKREYLLPTIIGGLLEKGTADVEVRQSSDEWFGVTYKEDKDAVVKAIRQLIEDGIYPEKLFQ